MVKTSCSNLVAGAVMALLSMHAFASEGEIKHRIAIMKALGGHMAAVAVSVRGEAANAEDLPFHAQSIVALSRIATRVFPASSAGNGPSVKTRAKARIWNNADQFETALTQFQRAAADFSNRVASGGVASVEAGFQELGRACKGCHDEFRRKN